MEPQTHDLDTLRHSAAHVLAMAALRLFPEAKVGVGPVNELGFYYDFEFPRPITENDLRQIEAEMNLIIQAAEPFQQIVVGKEEGFDILLKRGQIFKAELLRDIPEAEVSFYRTGNEFIDLCRGPHVANTNQVGVVKLTELTEAHWRGDHTRPKLQRIAGVAFPTIKELQEHLETKAAIANRDFRKVGKHLQLTLGNQSDVVFTPGGTLAFRQIQKTITDKFRNQDYSEILTSPINDLGQIETGLDKFYAHKNRSYKELPIRVYTSSRSELAAPVKITERELHSISTIASKAYFMASDRFMELQTQLAAIAESFETLNIPKLSAQIYIADPEAELLSQITETLQRKGISQTHIIKPQIHGAEVLFTAKDSLGRQWDLCHCYYTEQSIEYIDRSGQIALGNSLSSHWIVESILGFFIEDQEGLLPLWLAPIQVTIIPIAEEQIDYAEKVQKNLIKNGLRAQIDARSETMQARIRHAELLKIPIIIVIGEKERQNNSVSLRLRNQKEVGLVSEETLADTIFGLYR